MAILLGGMAALVAGSLLYSLLSVVAAFRYLAASPPRDVAAHEPVSVLKPLSGLDEGLEENLRGFFEQDYSSAGHPLFELIFAVRQESDPSVPLVRRLCAEYSSVPARLMVTGEPPYPHAKVFSLARMIAEARHDLVVMSDSDIRVTRDFLRRVVSEFAAEFATEFAAELPGVQTALATCPYRALAGPSLWSRLEATGINTTFWQGAFTARMLHGMKFAVGPTTVARRKFIDETGGIEGLKDYLAEDFELGRRMAAAGHRVILSSSIVEHRIGSETAAQNLGHRIRWARTGRRSRPSGYLGQIFTYPVPLAVLLWAIAPLPWWPIVVTTLGVRAMSAWVTSQVVLGARINWLLLPLEDILGFLFWIAGFFGNSITWRGRTYRLDRDGRAIA